MVAANGLSNLNVRCVIEDEWGRIYVGTVRGVDRIDVAKEQLTHYTVADGLSDSELNQALRNRAGGLWFATYRGVSRLMPEVERAVVPPSIFFDGLRVAGQPQPLSELGAQRVSGLELAATQNQLQFDFFSQDFGAGETLHYQYRMEGSDHAWSKPTEQRNVTYNAVSLPGQSDQHERRG